MSTVSLGMNQHSLQLFNYSEITSAYDVLHFINENVHYFSFMWSRGALGDHLQLSPLRLQYDLGKICPQTLLDRNGFNC